MLAAETAFEAIRGGDTSARALSAYKARIDASPIKTELYPVRGVHQAFAGGLYAGSMFAGLAMLTGGRLPGDIVVDPVRNRAPAKAKGSKAPGKQKL